MITAHREPRPLVATGFPIGIEQEQTTMTTKQLTHTDNLNMVTHDYARKLARHMGWEVDPIPAHFNYIPTTAVVRHPAGYAFRIGTQDRKPDRWEVRGDYSQEVIRVKRYNETLPGITIAKSKTVEQVAKEITSRFLPVFVPRWKEMRKQADDHAAYEKARTEGLAKLADLCNESVYSHKEAFRLGRINDNSGGFWGECSSESATSVRLEIRSCPYDLAEQVLRTLGLIKG